MLIDHTPAPAHAVVNLAELAEVRRAHLPPVLVHLVPLAELGRRARELAREQPRLQEEAAFVVADETARRRRLAGPVLTRSR